MMYSNLIKSVLALLALAFMLATPSWTGSNALARNATNAILPAADTTPPDIWIVSPTDGAPLSGRFQVHFYAFDIGGIDRYELYVDGELYKTILPTAKNPYFTVRESAGPHTLVCRAYDLAGNVGTSPIVNVAVK